MGCVCANLAHVRTSKRDEHAHVVTQSIYAMSVIHRYRLAVAAFVLLHKVYRITLPLHPSSFSHSFVDVPTMRQHGRETRERDKLTDDWYLMKICLPVGRKIRDESGMNWLRGCIKDVSSYGTAHTRAKRTCVDRVFVKLGDIKRAFCMQ